MTQETYQKMKELYFALAVFSIARREQTTVSGRSSHVKTELRVSNIWQFYENINHSIKRNLQF